MLSKIIGGKNYNRKRIIVYLVIILLVIPLTVFLTREKTFSSEASQTNSPQNPDFFPLAPCPSCTTPTEAQISRGQINAAVGTNPTTNNPKPCSSESTVEDNAKKKGSKHTAKKGGISKGMDSVIELLKKLLSLLLGGGNQPSQSNTQQSTTTTPTPCPPNEESKQQPSQNTQPSSPSQTQSLIMPSSRALPSTMPSGGQSQSVGTNGNTPTADTCSGNGTGGSLDNNGWVLSGCDDFNGSALDTSKWTAYDGPGHAGQGKRSPAQAKTTNGILTITGTSDGTTAGISWKTGQKFGRWEGRMRAPASDKSYNALFLLWPDAEDFPVGGEIDFVEMLDNTRQKTDFFLHYGANNSQVNGQVTIDATQWHNWAVEWTDKQITAYVDGKEWYKVTDTSKFPPRSMHMTIQLDWFPKGGAVKQSEMHVDWVHIYQKK